MMQWLKKDRCKVCSVERSVRYCLRRNKELGWNCCNAYRADGKCPEACTYSPKKNNSNSLLPMIKSDSRSEFIDYLERYLQSWIHLPIPELDNNTPNDMIQSVEGKTRLMNWLSGFTFVDNGILSILNKKLGLELPITPEAKPNLEEIAQNYLDAVIEQDWETVAKFHTGKTDYPEAAIEYISKQLASHPMLKKVKSHALINAGFTEDMKQAFVYCELNSRHNWTFIFADNGTTWQLYQLIWGTLQDYYEQKKQFRNIAFNISQRNSEGLFDMLYEVKDKYPLSADIQYYYALYYALIERSSDAKNALLNAVYIEPNWQEPLFQLAFMYMNEKDYLTSITHWEKLVELNPDDANAMNNIGVCYLGLGRNEEAKQAWEKAMTIDPHSEVAKKNLEHLNNG